MWSRLFNRAKPPEPPSIEAILQAYGAVLESSDPVDDEARLPFPKPTIKVSLIAALSATDDPQLRDQLIGAYVALSSFQPLSSAEREVLQREKAVREKLLASNSVDHADIVAHASVFAACRVLRGQVTQEMNDLAAELKDVGVTSA